MANSKVENLLYFKANQAFESCILAIRMFESYLGTAGPGATPDYYKARNYLRDAEKFYNETFAEAKKLLGPLPPYSSAEFEKWRSEFLSQHKILVESQEFESLKEELSKSEQILRWIGSADLDRLLLKNYDAQKTGKRKISNIKIRILLDRLREMMILADSLKKRAMEKLQKGA
jgi:hypothetical protein